ncbi:MAG: adenylate/guanylate cyclase domain-containing protein [Hyphomicrobiaceae bacterium]
MSSKVDGLAPRLSAIVFVDISQYSRRVYANEREFFPTADRCLDIFRDVSDRYNGELIRTTGDGALLIFSSALAAVHGALEVHRLLGEISAPGEDDDPIRSRIGIHLGDVKRHGGDLYGSAVNIASRLESICVPGQTYVSGAIFDAVKSQAEFGFELLGEFRLKNIPDRIAVYLATANAQRSARASSPRALPSPTVVPDRPSVAVLPFRGKSGAAGHDYLGEGIAEEIIDGLSRFRDVFVVSRGSSFALRDPTLTPAEVGTCLGVRYLIEGSFTITTRDFEVTTRLTDTTTNRQIHSDHRNGVIEIFSSTLASTIRQLTAVIVRRLEIQTVEQSATAAHSFQAYRNYLEGRSRLLAMTREENSAAQELFGRAIAVEPNYARAAAGMARALNYASQFGWDANPEQTLQEAFRWARQAVHLDALDPAGHAELGFAYLARREHAEALKCLQTASTLNPNDPDIMIELAEVLTYSGKAAEAVALIQDAMRLNPYYPDTYLWYLADAYFSLRRHEDVIDAVGRMNNPTIGCRLMAASLAHLDDLDQARQWADTVLRLQPGFSVESYVRDVVPDGDEEDARHFIEGLRKAGLPD